MGDITSKYSILTEEPRLKALQEAFLGIMDFIGIYNSKHDKKALDVSVVDQRDFPVNCKLSELKESLERYKNMSKDG